jgi:MOSC domain-containing protein YiiM
VSARIRHLFLSTGHNYFGHHGQAAGTHAVSEVDQLECVAGRGIRGDRFFDFRANYKGQITFFAWEDFAALQEELRLTAAAPAALRRNVVVEGVAIKGLVGETFSLQGVSFFGTEECRPCYWMDRALSAGAEAWLKGRGGLRARILSDGVLTRGETGLMRGESRRDTIAITAHAP